MSGGYWAWSDSCSSLRMLSPRRHDRQRSLSILSRTRLAAKAALMSEGHAMRLSRRHASNTWPKTITWPFWRIEDRGSRSRFRQTAWTMAITASRLKVDAASVLLPIAVTGRIEGIAFGCRSLAARILALRGRRRRFGRFGLDGCVGNRCHGCRSEVRAAGVHCRTVPAH